MNRKAIFVYVLCAVIAAAVATITVVLLSGGAKDDAATSDTGARISSVKARIGGPDLQRLTTVDEERRIRGRLRSPMGRVAGLPVYLKRKTKAWPVLDLADVNQTFTAADGTFLFDQARGPDYYIQVRNTGRELADRLVPAPPEIEDLVIDLETGFLVNGRVTGPNGASVANCRVVITHENDERKAITVRADGDGFFVFDDIAGGLVRIEARNEVYRPVGRLVTVGAGEVLRLQFGPEPGVVVRGQVLDLRDKAPVVGATVVALPNDLNRGFHEPDRATTDAEGRFEIRGQGTGNRWIEVQHPDYSTVSRVVQVRAGGNSLGFELARRTTVRGRLDGPVVGGEQIVLRGPGAAFGRADVAPDGTFEFPEPITAGAVTLEIEDGRLAFAASRRREHNVTLEEQAVNELVLPVQAPGEVLGRVVDQDGKPVAGAVLTLAPPSREAGGLLTWAMERLTDIDRAVILAGTQRVLGVSGSDGTFRIAGLPQGEIGVLVDSQEHARLRLVVDVPEVGRSVQVDDVKLTLGGSIQGTVVRTPTGDQTLAGAYVFLNTPNTGMVSTISDADGRFVLPRLPPGNYRVRARYSTLPTARTPVAPRVVEGEPTEVRLSFGSGADREVKGVIRDGNRQPVRDATVMVSGIAGTEVRTAADGSFALIVPPREVELWIRSPDGQTEIFQTVPRFARSLNVELDTPPTGGVRGRVTGLPDNRPVQAGVLRIEPVDGDDDPLRGIRSLGVSMPGGELDVSGLPVGLVQLVLHCEGYAPRVLRRLRIREGATESIGDLRLEPGSAVEVVVLDPSGEPVPGASIYVGEVLDQFELSRVGALPSLVTDDDGRALVRGVSHQASQVVVSAPGYAVLTHRLALPEDVFRGEPLPLQLESGATLSISVINENARPWEQGLVQIAYDDAPLTVLPLTEEGRVEFEHAARGTYTLSVVGRSGSSEIVRVTQNNDRYEVVLKAR